MNLVCKISCLLLLCYIKLALVNAVCNNSLSKLYTSKVMKNHTVFSSVDNGTVVKLLKFFRKLSLVSQLFKSGKNSLVNLFCSVIVV